MKKKITKKINKRALGFCKETKMFVDALECKPTKEEILDIDDKMRILKKSSLWGSIQTMYCPGNAKCKHDAFVDWKNPKK